MARDNLKVVVPETPDPPPPPPPPEREPYREPMPAEIAKAVAEVMAGASYVQKRGFNRDQNYKYTAVGDLLAKLQPEMAKAGLVPIQDEGEFGFLDTGGKIMKIKYRFTLHHISGLSWPKFKPIEKTGVARLEFKTGGVDDKAVNKCATAARKYFLLELFQIASGELAEPDADGEDRPGSGFPPNGDPRFAGDPPLESRQECEPSKDERRQNAENWHRNAMAELDDIKTGDGLFEWENNNSDTIAKLFRNHNDLHKTLMAKMQQRGADLG